jgi:WD40 repeat protein
MLRLDGTGEFFIDRCGNGFDRILEYMSTEVLSTEGLNRYDEDCMFANLVYFRIPHKSRLDYSKVSQIENLYVIVYLQLLDGGLCGSSSDYSICICNMDTNVIEKIIDGRLCSCSDNTTIKLWNIGSGLCELTIDAHSSAVYCVIQLLDGRLCSGSGENTFKIWRKDSRVCELTVNVGNLIYRIV